MVSWPDRMDDWMSLCGCRIFSPDSPCQLMQAEGHCHIFFNCEPDIWMVMVSFVLIYLQVYWKVQVAGAIYSGLNQVIEKSKDGEEEVRVGAMEAMLKEAHDLFAMFFGSIRGLLQKQLAGDLARSFLHAFFPDYLAGKMNLFWIKVWFIQNFVIINLVHLCPFWHL